VDSLDDFWEGLFDSFGFFLFFWGEKGPLRFFLDCWLSFLFRMANLTLVFPFWGFPDIDEAFVVNDTRFSFFAPKFSLVPLHHILSPWSLYPPFPPHFEHLLPQPPNKFWLEGLPSDLPTGSFPRSDHFLKLPEVGVFQSNLFSAFAGVFSVGEFWVTSPPWPPAPRTGPPFSPPVGQTLTTRCAVPFPLSPPNFLFCSILSVTVGDNPPPFHGAPSDRRHAIRLGLFLFLLAFFFLVFF